jgi:RNA polymerase sigma factor (sigma-70 family)
MEVAYKQTLQELIDGCLDNNRTAQKRLYERYYGQLMGVCMRYASCKDGATVMLNNAFMKIFTTIKQCKNTGGNFEGWMYRIVVNTAIDQLRSETRHQHTDIEKAVYKEESFDVIASMEAEEIIALVNQLTPAYRAVFNLFAIEGFTHVEIAEMLDINEGTSKSNLFKARMKLQEMIRLRNEVKVDVYAK